MGLLRCLLSDGVFLCVTIGVIAAVIEQIIACLYCQESARDLLVSMYLYRPYDHIHWEVGGQRLGLYYLAFAVVVIPLVFEWLRIKKIADLGPLHLASSYGVFMGLVIYFPCYFWCSLIGVSEDVAYQCFSLAQDAYIDACPFVLALPLIAREIARLSKLEPDKPDSVKPSV